ncbi:MAG: tRNA dihydrouridine(20/20a) synthase DusA [Wenzhouxiangellaceae bacterium]
MMHGAVANPADGRRVPRSAWRLCVAPMMDWTDRHCRYFHRLLAPSARLYTEMVTSAAVIHGDRDHLLGFDSAEHPVALQLGGSDPDELARSARIGEQYGYDEINLNCGCPSDRVQRGRFGACLMTEPERVRDCLAAMHAAVSVPVTLKTRIGVDDHDSEEFLHRFVETTAASGIDALIVHARKAWLSGLSPKQNREIPPLDYARVERLRAAFPGLPIVLNGGLETVSASLDAVGRFDGVMLGRAAYQRPWILAELERALGGAAPECPENVLPTLVDYARRQIGRGVRLQAVGRHVLGLFHGRPGARIWRRALSQNMHLDRSGPELLLEAAARTADAVGRIRAAASLGESFEASSGRSNGVSVRS